MVCPSHPFGTAPDDFGILVSNLIELRSFHLIQSGSRSFAGVETTSLVPLEKLREARDNDMESLAIVPFGNA